MKRRTKLIAAAALTAAPAAAIVAPSTASANTVCTPYTETTGACMTQYYDENGVFRTILSFYWGNWYVDIQLV